MKATVKSHHDRVQRMACLNLQGVIRITPLRGTEVLLDLLPLYVFFAREANHPLRTLGCWTGPRAEGHRSILETDVARGYTLPNDIGCSN